MIERPSRRTKRNTQLNKLRNKYFAELMTPEMAAKSIILTGANKRYLLNEIEKEIKEGGYRALITPPKRKNIRLVTNVILGITFTRPLPTTLDSDHTIQLAWLELAAEYLRKEGFTVEINKTQHFLYDRLFVEGWYN